MGDLLYNICRRITKDSRMPALGHIYRVVWYFDALLYQLYGLTQEEIRIVEAK